MLGERKKNEGKLDDFYTWYSTTEVFRKAEEIGSGIINMELVEKVNEWNNYELQMIGIYSANTLNYLFCDIACIFYGLTIIPIYDTLGEDATAFAFNQTKMKSCFVSTKHVEKILQLKQQSKF